MEVMHARAWDGRGQTSDYPTVVGSVARTGLRWSLKRLNAAGLPGFYRWGFLVSRLSRKPVFTQGAGLGPAVLLVAGQEP